MIYQDQDGQLDETKPQAMAREFAHEMEISLLFSLHGLPYLRRGFNFCRNPYGTMIEIILGFRGGTAATSVLSKIGKDMYERLKTWLQEQKYTTEPSEREKSQNPKSHNQPVVIRFHIRIEATNPSLRWDNASICGEICVKTDNEYALAIHAVKDLSQLLVNIEQPKQQEIDQYLERSYLSRYSSYDMVRKHWNLDR